MLGEIEGTGTRDGQQQQLLMSAAQGKDTSKSLLNTDMNVGREGRKSWCKGTCDAACGCFKHKVYIKIHGTIDVNTS